MATLLQVQEDYKEPYWLDVSRKNDSIPRSDFSPVYFDVTDVATKGQVFASSTLHELRPSAKLRAPFISGLSTGLDGLGLEVNLLVCDGGNDGSFTKKREVSLCNNVTYITYESLTNASRGYFSNDPKQYELAEPKSYKYLSTRSFDFAFINSGGNDFAVWVNATNVYPVDEYNYSGNVVPQVSFPFTRLASINVPEKSSYLYHQINETTLAEEQYDLSLHEWLTTYITVPNP